MVSLTFYGGINEIGGNKILVKDGDTSVFLDFGKSFSRWGMFFEEYLKPTSSRGIETFWKTGLLPDLEGVYRPDLLEFAGAKVHKEPAVDAVLLSHAHQDHASYISFLDNAIPVHCSEVTKTVMEAVQEVGKRDLETEITNYKPRPMLRKDYMKPPVKRNLHTVKAGGKVKVGSIEAHFLPVDHSIPGACAMLLHCSDATIVYSGDMRLHGTHGHLTQEFAEKAAIEKADIFLCEGTRINTTENHGEPYVKAHSEKIIGESKGLILADFSWKDTTRIMTFYNAAKASGRKLLLPMRTAYYLEQLKVHIPELPSAKDEHVLLYLEKAGSGTYDDGDYTEKWKKAYLSHSNLARADWISAHQSEVVACLGYFDALDLIDIQPAQGSQYIHSMSEPYNEEQEFDKTRMENWLTLFDLPRHQVHASGHAPQQDIFSVIETVSAGTLVPIHTEHAELFGQTKRKIRMAEVGKEMGV